MDTQKHMEDHLISIRLDSKRSEKERKAAGYKLKWLGLGDASNDFRENNQQIEQ